MTDPISVKKLVYLKLKEQGLPTETLNIHNIWEENLDNLSWETAVKLCKFFGLPEAFWMNVDWAYKQSLAKR